MQYAVGIAARAISTLGLGCVAVLHVVWATGSPWPARDGKRLAEAVIGSHSDQPGAVPTLVVAGGTAGAALLASGALGDGRLQRLGLRAMGTVLLARGVLGGEAALAAMGMPRPGRTFQRLDRRVYRPLTIVLGAALWVSSLSRR